MAQTIDKHNQSSSDNVILKATLLITSTLTVMAGATIAPALPAIQAHFSETDNIEFWTRLVLTLPALFIVIGSPIAGWFVDRFGRKQLLIASAILYGLAGSSGFYASSLPIVLLGRALLGLAVGGVMTSVTTLIADYYEGDARSNFMGWQNAFMGFGGTLFLTFGGILADIGWQMPFLIYLAAFVILPFMVFSLYEPPRDKPQESSSTQSNPTEKIRLPISLMIFIYGTVILVQTVFYIIPVQLPFHLQTLLDASGSESGLAIAWSALAFSIASSTFSWFDKRFSHISLVIIGLTIIGISNILLDLSTSWIWVICALPLNGFGIGLIMPNLNVWLANEAPEAVRGRLLGGFTTALFLGQFLSPIITQPITQQVGIPLTFGIVGSLLLILSSTLLITRRQVGNLLSH